MYDVPFWYLPKFHRFYLLLVHVVLLFHLVVLAVYINHSGLPSTPSLWFVSCLGEGTAGIDRFRSFFFVFSEKATRAGDEKQRK